MYLNVRHSHHYEWQIRPETEAGEGDVVAAAPQAGAVAVRTRVESDPDVHVTTVHIPEDMIDRNLATGKFRSRSAFIAHHLSESALVHAVPGDAVTGVDVPEEPELEGFLNGYFETDRPKASRKGRKSEEGALRLGFLAGLRFRRRTRGRLQNRGWAAIFSHSVTRADGTTEPLNINPNLRTNAGIDWTGALMGGGLGASAQFTSAATSTTATSLTNTGAAFPTATVGGLAGLAGKIVVAGTVWGVIISNTATVLTVDKWYNPASPGGAAGSTPGGTASYVILPGSSPNWWMALTTDAGAPAAGDTTLASELTTNGFARALGGWTHTAAVNTYTLNNTFTCTGGAGTTINKEAVFNAQNGGIMTFESAEPSPPTLLTNDTLNQSVVVTF